MLRIGLCGAHRTGKSTLAAALAERLGIVQVPSPVSRIARSYGFDMDKDRRDDPRFFAMQQEILRELTMSVMQPSQFVSDRTPLDAAAYLLADVQANTGDDAWREEVLIYADRARMVTDKFYDFVFLVPPGIDFDPMDGKPGANLAYQEHHHLICRGLMDDLVTPHAALQRENLRLEDRVDAIVDYVRAVQRRQAKRREALKAA
jgi:predicted ATPase